ncbi:MAG: P1 family peptidase [Chloroflexota bacterium]
MSGEGPLVVGQGPVRTGVTVVIPHEDDVWIDVFAGCHRLNGNGELTGLEWVRRSGFLGGVIGITSTHPLGGRRPRQRSSPTPPAPAPTNSVFWSLPVVGETYDGAPTTSMGFT